jgi:Arc/MetJ-type ribon-helix-helix transcriptional regulator
MNRQPPSIRVYTTITPELHKLLQQVRIAKRFRYDSELVRAALRAYLETQSDQVASKRHFNFTLRRRLDRIDWHLTVITYLLAQALAMLITSITGKKLPSETLLEQSIKMAASKHTTFIAQLDERHPEMDESIS